VTVADQLAALGMAADDAVSRAAQVARVRAAFAAQVGASSAGLRIARCYTRAGAVVDWTG